MSLLFTNNKYTALNFNEMNKYVYGCNGQGSWLLRVAEQCLSLYGTS